MEKPKTPQAVAEYLRSKHNPSPLLPWEKIFSLIQVGSLIQHKDGGIYEICAKSEVHDYVNLFSLNGPHYGDFHRDYRVWQGAIWKLVQLPELPDTEDFL